MKRLFLCSAVLTVLLAATSNTLRACGINFSLPSLHFPHVNDQGKFSYWEKIGEIDVGSGLVLPIHLNFNADRHSVSPTLNARGFLLGLTDASAVQLDERKFRIYTPAGRYRTFYRDRKNPNVIHSGKNWKGELKGDVLSVASECGDRLTYHQGVISQMQVKDRKFDFIKSGMKITEIREGGKTILKVATDSKNEDIILSYGLNKKINFQFGQRPIVQTINGQNVVGQKARSLNKIVGENGFMREFEFTVNKEIQPMLRVDDVELTWDPSTGFLVSDGKWHYDVKAGELDSSNAAIARANSSGQKEFWHHDKSRGEETTELLDGTSKFRAWFTNGLLKGKVRQERVGNKSKRFSYNEQGNLVRVIHSSGEIEEIKYFEFKEQGEDRILKIKNDPDGNKVYSLHDRLGRLLSRFSTENGLCHEFVWKADGSAKLNAETVLAQPSKWTRQAIYQQEKTIQ